MGQAAEPSMRSGLAHCGRNVAAGQIQIPDALIFRGNVNAGLIMDGGHSLLVDTLFDEQLTAEMPGTMKAAAGPQSLFSKATRIRCRRAASMSCPEVDATRCRPASIRLRYSCSSRQILSIRGHTSRGSAYNAADPNVPSNIGGNTTGTPMAIASNTARPNSSM